MSSGRCERARALSVAVLSVSLSVSPAMAKDSMPSTKVTSATAAVSASVSVDAVRKLSRTADQLGKDSTDTWAALAKAYKTATADRDAQVQRINEIFTAAVRQAKLDYLRALTKAAKSTAAKTAAKDAFDATLAAATDARQSAINALKPLPPSPKAMPTKPAK